MRIKVIDMGGHAPIYIDGNQVGYFNYDTAWNKDIPQMNMRRDEIYLRWAEIAPIFRGTGAADAAYQQLERIFKEKGIKRIVTWPMEFREKWVVANGYVPSRRNTFCWEKDLR